VQTTVPTAERVLRRYYLLRNQITAASGKLFATYTDHLKCRRGCSFCCDPIAVAPIEREAIRRWAKENDYQANHEPAPNRCACLQPDGACAIYPSRPIICRTFGLPLSYRTYEYDLHGREIHRDPPQYTDLWCELNFSSISETDAPHFFDRNGRLRMSDINQRVDALNEAFVSATNGARDPEARPLSALPELRYRQKR
jgi:Fe-S-cluster containining protein